MKPKDKFLNKPSGEIIEYEGIEKLSKNLLFRYVNSSKKSSLLLYTPEIWEKEKIFSIWQPYKE